MYRKGHIGIGLLGYAPVVAAVAALAPDRHLLALAGYAPVLWGATLPDVDLVLVRWQSRLPGVVRRHLPVEIRHRGATHTVWFGLLVGGALGGGAGGLAAASESPPAPPVSPGAAALVAGGGAFLGVLLHLAGDAITLTGIRPFRPVSDRRVRRVVTVLGHRSAAGSDAWNDAFFLAGLAATVVALTVAGGAG